MKTIVPASLFTLLNINFNILPPVHLLLVMGIAIGLDFITGVGKAIVLKEARTSNGYRKTVKKFIQYGGSIAVTLMIRYLASKQPELLDGVKYIGWIGNGLMVFIIMIECTSIFENLYAIDNTSMMSKYLIKPFLKILTFQIKNNPIANNDKQKEEPAT